MTTSPSSGLSPEAKEFVPLIQTPITSIPLYVDENTIASMYPSDQQPLMVQTIYPMMITNSKVTDSIANNLLQFPEIEFHIQPSQQQQFHIDSCSNLSQTNGNSSSNNTSQIVLLPTTNTTAITPTGYYPGPQILYSTNDQTSTFYPMDYCEQPLINFSLQQPQQITKSNRASSQQQRPSSFRQQHGMNHSLYRPSSRGGGGGNRGGNNRNSYYDYNNRRNCSSYTQNPGRGNPSNTKRISSSYHPHDCNNYYHTSSRSRGYLPRSSQQQHDDQRKENFDYYNHENDFYEDDYQQTNQMNDDGTPFEFRPEDFPSLPINNQQSDKTPPQSIISTNTKSTSSWNTIVSAPRPRSTSPHSVPPSSTQSQDPRSDRSRSFNNKFSSNNKKSSHQTTKPKSPNRASKANSQEEQQQRSKSLTNSDLPIIENNIQTNDIKDDGFIQTKQQQRRLKRRSKIKDESVIIPFTDQSTIIESALFALDDENTFPTLGQQISSSTTNKKSEIDSTIKDNSTSELVRKTNPKANQTYQVCLTDMFNALSTSTQVKQPTSHIKASTITTINPLDSKSVSKRGKEREQPKSRKSTKVKRITNQELEENQNQRQQASSKATVEKQSDVNDIQSETDTNITNVPEADYQNSNPLSSSNTNSSDTSDYDDAVDNLDDE